MVDNPAMNQESAPSDVRASFAGLPPYARSLLAVRVPVAVTLASKKQTVHEITQLGPGAIIKFDKSCDDLLDLTVGGRPIANGEVVKVGDKFGLRIRSMQMPGERFVTVRPSSSQ
jgi:flagellar motor switch protein FliN/FliY